MYKKIYEKLIRTENYTAKELEIVLYGIHAIIEIGITFIICFFIMFITHSYIEGLLFFSVFIPLRSFAGGFHFDNAWICTIISTLYFFLIMETSHFTVVNCKISYILGILSMIAILCISPVINDSRPILPEEYHTFGIRLMLFICCIFVAESILYYLNNQHYLWLITLVLLSMICILFLGKIKWKSLNKHNSYFRKFCFYIRLKSIS